MMFSNIMRTASDIIYSKLCFGMARHVCEVLTESDQAITYVAPCEETVQNYINEEADRLTRRADIPQTREREEQRKTILRAELSNMERAMVHSTPTSGSGRPLAQSSGSGEPLADTGGGGRPLAELRPKYPTMKQVQKAHPPSPQASQAIG